MALQPPVVILADGPFPTHPEPLRRIHTAGTLICCDGAANGLHDRGLTPAIVIGDLDSIAENTRRAWRDRLVELPGQDTNDLEKAIRWAAEQGAAELAITGALGGRDDHTLAALFMLWTDFGVKVELVTDAGRLVRIDSRTRRDAYPGQTVGLFPLSAEVRFSTQGLIWELADEALPAMHSGASNRSAGERISIGVSGGPALLFLAHRPE